MTSDSTFPADAELIVATPEIEAALDRMAQAIAEHYAGKSPIILTVMNGGMLTATQLAMRLSLPLRMDYLHVSRYRDESGADLQWHARPRLNLNGQHVLIVDDILDEGPTLRALLNYCRGEGAASVASAVLVEKEHQRRVDDVHADFIGLRTEDRYLFGYGMDFRGGWRHLPAIYALPA